MSFLILIYFQCLFSLFPKIQTEELQNARESESKFKQQHIEALKREKMLIRRLAAKEQEMQEYVVRSTCFSQLFFFLQFERMKRD